MKKLFLYVSGLGLLSAPAFAQEAKPTECLNTYSKKVRILQCNDFNKSYPNNYTNVCIFKDNSWQWGNLVYNKKTSKHDFTYKQPCDQGVNVVRSQESIKYTSPRLADFFEKRTSVVNYESSRYVSKMTTNPLLETKEVPVTCYLQDNAGVASNPQACNADPNSSGFCEFIDTGTTYTKYRGSWWVRYASANKKTPKLCIGGIVASNAEQASAEYGESQAYQDAKVYIKKDLIAALPTPVLPEATVTEEANTTNFRIVACTYGTKNVRTPCSNQTSTAEYEAWVDDETALKQAIEYKLLTQRKPAGKSRTFVIEMNRAKSEYLFAKSRSLSFPNNENYKLEYEKLLNAYEMLENEYLTLVNSEFEAQSQKAFPVDRTTRALNGCYIKWAYNEAGNKISDIYIVTKLNGTTITKEPCSKLDTVIDRSIAGN